MKYGKIVAIFLCLIFAIPAFLALVKSDQEPLFTITLIAPGNANLVRRQWALIIANSLRNVGIDAKVVYLGWGAVYDRVLTPAPEKVGLTYDEGGFDALFIGWTPGLVPDPKQIFYGDAATLAPSGNNYYLWVDQKNNKLIEDYVTATTAADRDAALVSWQKYFNEQMPDIQILYETTVAARNPAVSNVEWLHFNVRPSPEWFKTSKTAVTYASTGELVALNPPLSSSWYDSIVFVPIFGSMADWSYDKKLIPSLATSWSISGNTWTINLRQGVKWHDGAEFTADDVLFSYWAILNANVGSQYVGYYAGWLGTDTFFTWLNGTTTEEVNFEGKTYSSKPAGATGLTIGTLEAVDKYTVKITQPNVGELGKPNTLFEVIGMTAAMIPKHVLEKIPEAEWATHPFNTGQGGPYTVQLPGGGTYQANGPIGTGPYTFGSFDTVNQIIQETKFTDYWNRTALEVAGMYNVGTYYVRYIVGKESAIAALKNSEVDILDLNYHMGKEAKAGVFDPSWGVVVDLAGAGRQELGFNMRHPIWGTGIDTPLGKKDPSKAAEAARQVRLAINCLIPRRLIIDSLLAGLGDPGITPALPTQPGYDSSLKPQEYDIEEAKRHLALAGYEVGTPITPPTVETKPADIFLGDHVHIRGEYVDTTTGKPLAGYLVQIQESESNTSWPSGYIAQGATDQNGIFDVIIKPNSEGTFYYRAYFPGVPARIELTGTIPSVEPRWSTEIVRVVVGPSLASELASIRSSLSSLSGQLDTVSQTMTNEIAALRNQVSQLTTVAYVGVLGLLIGLAALVLSFRKK